MHEFLSSLKQDNNILKNAVREKRFCPYSESQLMGLDPTDFVGEVKNTY